MNHAAIKFWSATRFFDGGEVKVRLGCKKKGRQGAKTSRDLAAKETIILTVKVMIIIIIVIVIAPVETTKTTATK